MKKLKPIHIETAEKLIDFKGKSEAAMSFAEIQLKGAVAVYNMLIAQKFAYLADEVGMGKTYVALGAVALMKHFKPDLRVLYITPRKNIQKKWLKEIRNFTANNWKAVDHKVKTFQNAPASMPVLCERLKDYVHELAIDPHRDFILRMTSFSLPNSTRDFKANLKSLIEDMPWIAPDKNRLDRCAPEQLKDIYGAALNKIIPDYDLVVIDEGHNFKHGFGNKVSARNRVFGLTFGKPLAPDLDWLGWENRQKLKTALILSATPLEYDYRHLWNQMDLAGFGKLAEKLCDQDLDDESKKEIAAKFIVRRLTRFTINSKEYTKNMYRREWRGGGLDNHDESLEFKNDPRQRLIVALIQKKVSEVMESRGIESGRKFSRSFQIGMLSSFESFFQTAAIKESDSMVFDQTEQVDDDNEKKGIDTLSVNQIAESYKRKFGLSMPHPKMDLVADEAFNAMKSGEKTLLFVRRIGSVKELSQKISEKYDSWVKEYILINLPEKLHSSFSGIYSNYISEKKSRRGAVLDTNIHASTPEEEITETDDYEKDDEGGLDSFFSWFFRGKPHPDFNTGISFRKNRLDSRNSPYSLMFEENYLNYLLGEDNDYISRIADFANMDRKECIRKLKDLSYAIYTQNSISSKFQKYYMYYAYQQAALIILASSGNPEVAVCAEIILDISFSPYDSFISELKKVPADYPGPDEFLSIGTFFTELSIADELAKEIWLGNIYGKDNRSVPADFADYFREREERRILISTAVKLGHPLIDLWLIATNELGSIEKIRTTDTSDVVQKIIQEFIKLLSVQKELKSLTSYKELSLITENFNLISDVNFHDISERKVFGLKNYFADTLGSQYPVSGMHGGVNARIVKQFRMPGYPYVLVTTDVLQEGEDLHTFCCRINHYGITYTPSAMEQRTGRIDRIGSLTGRKMDSIDELTDNHKLQVYFPYLKDTCEIVQAHEVFRRMNKFIELMHTNITTSEHYSTNTQISTAALKSVRAIDPVKELLLSPFDAKDEYIYCGDKMFQPVIPDNEAIVAAFNKLIDGISSYYKVEWDNSSNPSDSNCFQRLGTFFVQNTNLVKTDIGNLSVRKQPVSIHLKTGNGGRFIIKIISPVGNVNYYEESELKRIIKIQKKYPEAKLCAFQDENYETYNFTVEADMLFGVKTTSLEEILYMIRKSVITADIVEREILETDKNLHEFRSDLVREVVYE